MSLEGPSRAVAFIGLAVFALSAASACRTPRNAAVPAPRAAAPAPKAAAPAVPWSRSPAAARLVLVHLSDSEAGLLPDDASAAGGGLARAQAVISALKARGGDDALVLAAGDLYIPSPELSLEIAGKSAVLTGNTMLSLQASALGNHELDLGEEFLGNAIAAMSFPYLTSTLAVTSGPLEKVLADVSHGTPWADDIPGKLVPRAKACVGKRVGAACDGLVVGLVGATTEELRLISKGASADLASPNDLDGVRADIQKNVDALTQEGVHVVILLSHLQGAFREAQLVKDGLTGVDIIVAGGGENRLAAKGDRLLEKDEPDRLCKVFGEPCYPTALVARDGKPTLLVATSGDLRYVGNLVADFDADGVLTGTDDTASRPWPVDEESLIELRAHLDKKTLAFQQQVRDDLQPLLEEIGSSDVFLEGTREEVRNRETNLGDLSADAIVYAARALSPALGLRNGGGIRASVGIVDSITGERKGGPIRMLDLKTALRFDSKVVVVDTTHAGLKATLESALRGAGTSKGQFPQVSSDVVLEYDVRAPEQTHVLKDGRIEKVACPGARVRTLVVGGVPVVREGKLLTPRAKIKVATIDYLAHGGDGWFPGDKNLAVTEVEGATEQSSFKDYVAALQQNGTWRGGGGYLDGVGARIKKVDAPVDDVPAGCAAPAP